MGERSGCQNPNDTIEKLLTKYTRPFGIDAPFRVTSVGTSNPHNNAPALAFRRHIISHTPCSRLTDLDPVKSTYVPGLSV